MRAVLLDEDSPHRVIAVATTALGTHEDTAASHATFWKRFSKKQRVGRAVQSAHFGTARAIDAMGTKDYWR
ncbi:hypothetical protein GCM10023075_46660 [Streptosporangium album]